MLDTATFAAAELDRAFRTARAHTGSSTNEVRIARALMEVGAVEAEPSAVTVALSAAARLEPQGVFTTGQVRLYSRGLAVHKLIDQAVAAAR